MGSLSSPLALSLTRRVATQPLFLHRISVVCVYLYIAATTLYPVGQDSRHRDPFIIIYPDEIFDFAAFEMILEVVTEKSAYKF